MISTTELDLALKSANGLVQDTILHGPRPIVKAFFDQPTSTASYIVHCPVTKVAAIIDSVLDFDAPSGRISHRSAEAMVDYARDHALIVEWLLETHAHAEG